MTTATLKQIGEVLSRVGAAGTFAARRTAAAEDLHLEIKGLGRLRFPISPAQAKRLCHLARPARYGRREQTLLDKQVRDTWKIAKSRVKIDRRRWNRTLLPVLEELRSDLGLPDGCRLKAELHAMLVYGLGQFFLPHQDSEKADDMVGSLVVILPSAFKGGAMVVEHQGKKVTYRAPKRPLAFIGFYADCHHEVRPVKEGYRVVLTYNLMLAGDGSAATTETAPATVDDLAERLREHFETPLPPRRYSPKDAPPREPPNRLVYLLDHQYSERGLAWHRLKGNDAARAAALRAAAEQLGGEVMLALAEIHETWDCMEDDGYDPWHRRHRRWVRDDDDEWIADDDPPPDSPDHFTLGELQSWSLQLRRWIDPSGKKAEPIATSVDDEEVCSNTPSSELEPYASEYEGYMGNYGNTMDRWYRRAALVLWPSERAFAVRAEASPAWALETLRQCLRAGRRAEAREWTASLLPFWEDAVGDETRRGFFAKVLRVAEHLDEPELAASLLQPFRIEMLTRGRASAMVALLKRYGEGWAGPVLSRWCDPDPQWRRPGGRDRLAWLRSLPRLCESLRAADDGAGARAGRLLLSEQWRWLRDAIKMFGGSRSPSRRDDALASLAKPMLGFLESTAVVETEDVRAEALAFLSAEDNEVLVPCLVQVLRAAEKVAPARRAAAGLDVLARHCTERIEARLALPARHEDDWSIALPGDCECELCKTLSVFLSDPNESRLEWPLAKNGRRHVHQTIDAHELPVRHQTRRSGRPFTLVLSKTRTLFEREADERRARQADLEWLAGWGRSR